MARPHGFPSSSSPRSGRRSRPSPSPPSCSGTWSPKLVEASAAEQLGESLRLLTRVLAPVGRPASPRCSRRASPRSPPARACALTVVSGEGTVLADSARTPPQVEAMDNHARRPEIAAALATGSGVERPAQRHHRGRLRLRGAHLHRPRTGASTCCASPSPCASCDMLRGRLAWAMVLAAGRRPGGRRRGLPLAVAPVLRPAGPDGGGRRRAGIGRLPPAPRDAGRASPGGALRGAQPPGGPGRAADRPGRRRARPPGGDRAQHVGRRAGHRRGGAGRCSPTRSCGASSTSPARSTGKSPLELVRRPELLAARRRHPGARARTRRHGARDAGPRPAHRRPRLDPPRAPGGRRGGEASSAWWWWRADVTQATRLDEMRRDFVANVSHELKTPLSAIRAYAETLRDGAIEDRPAAERFVAGSSTRAAASRRSSTTS